MNARVKRFAAALKSEGPGDRHNPSPTWLYAKQRGCCFHCGAWMKPHAAIRGKAGWTREHIPPKSRGGNRYVLACYRCNQERGDKLPTAADLFKMRMLYTGLSFDFPQLVEAA